MQVYNDNTHVMADYTRFDKVAAELSDDEAESPDLPLVPPPAEAAPSEAEPVSMPLTAEALAAHVERVGTIDVEEAAVRGVPLNALRPCIPDHLVAMAEAAGLGAEEGVTTVGDRLRKERDRAKAADREAQAAEVRKLVARATAIKEDGNEHFKKEDFGGAAERYQAALVIMQRSAALGRFDADELAEGLASLKSRADSAAAESARGLAVVCLVNLATCSLRRDVPEDAIISCDVALRLDDRKGKAWFRRGQAHTAVGSHAEAVKDLTRAAALLPKSSEVREALEESTRAALPETPGGVVV